MVTATTPYLQHGDCCGAALTNMLNMATISGTRSDISGKAPTYSTQAVSISRAGTSKEPGATNAAMFKNKLSSREKPSTSNKTNSSSPKSCGATEHQLNVKPPPHDGSRPLPNGPGPLNSRGEKLVGTDVLHNSRIIPRQSRKDGHFLTKDAGLTSTNSTQGLCRGQSDCDKASSEKLLSGGFRPPRSSSSVNISASGQAFAVGDVSSLISRFHDDGGKVVRKNLNSSNDHLESSAASDRRIRPKTKDVAVSSSTTPTKLSREKCSDPADPRALTSPARSGQQQHTNEFNCGHAFTEQAIVSGFLPRNKLIRSGTADCKLSRCNDTDDSTSICSARIQNLDFTSRFDTSAGLCGLQNLGNTCFMNSILQCLSNTRPLLEFCLLGNFSSQINTQTSSMKGAMIKAYVRLMEDMWKPSGSTHSVGCVSPTDFKYYISRYSRHFVGTREQDAHEFLVYLLEGLHEDLNRVREKKKRFIDCGDEVETISAMDKAKLSWERYVECDNSEIIDIFMGQLRSALTCKKCGYVSNTFEPFLALSLPIKQAGSQVSLSDCFKLFSHEETLDGDNKPKCAKCCTRNPCTKQMSIQKFPKVLVIHLMRFKQGTSSKLNTQVACPMTGLDLRQFTTAPGCLNAVYNLYAMSNHSGTPLTGHYTAYAKHPYSKQWHIFNDSRVTSISQSAVNSSEAYLLFYELQEPCLSS